MKVTDTERQALRKAWDDVQRTANTLGWWIVKLDDGTYRLASRIRGYTERDYWFEDDDSDHVTEAYYVPYTDWSECYSDCIHSNADGWVGQVDDEPPTHYDYEETEKLYDEIVLAMMDIDDYFEDWLSECEPGGRLYQGCVCE